MNKRALLGVTGSVAAYKAAELVRLFVKDGWDVRVIMTAAAGRFVGEATFASLSGNPVYTDMFKPSSEWSPEHVSLAGSADVLVIAPCTANVLAKLANGIADDLLSATALACRCPVVAAPAMNEAMWDNPATQSNVETLQARGVRVTGVDSGDLACGYSGRGRLAAVEKIMSEAREAAESRA
ncbi:MAG: flavoprotein [Kiritimatiellia bacterium]